MSLGKNLQFLRRMSNGMTQEELAEKMQVSRQTISKWELDAVCPDLGKVQELCQLFSCTMDDLVRGDMDVCDKSFINIRVETVEAFRYVRYEVISPDPETDAISHVKEWARSCGEEHPLIIGWDFPFLSQEQVNVFHMHGYAAAWVLPEGAAPEGDHWKIISQDRQKYAVVTIVDPFIEPFRTIPNAYKTLMACMRLNRLEHLEDRDVIACFEREYNRDGTNYMDVYIAVK